MLNILFKYIYIPNLLSSVIKVNYITRLVLDDHL